MPEFQRAPQTYMRWGGAAYLLIIALGLFGEAFVRGQLIVPGDGVTTAARIAASPGLWRLGMAADLLMQMLDVPLIVLFYLLLRHVSRPLALMSTAFNLIQTSVLAVNKLTLFAALLLAEQAATHTDLPPSTWGALTLLATDLHDYGFGIGLLFFGVTCVMQGYLIHRSGLLPPVLGSLLVVAGVAYLLNSAALITAPKLASALFPWVLLPALVGELALALWLLVRGIDLRRWANRLEGRPQQAG